MYKVGIITLSDTRSQNHEKDESGKIIKKILSDDYEIKQYIIIPDDQKLIINTLKHLVDDLALDLILTTGGTGFSKRDVTPEATSAVLDKECLGIAEAIRVNSLQITKKAMLSRAVAGLRKNTLIINLPGSPKAVKECLDYSLDAILHGLNILKGNVTDCAR
ncbi:MAG: MogA/MoaB family molybdenum cofactor biosynthesis protein [Bacteroidetes bacterium]|nr:MogA/MoaB family molybdenum cofactor biosynthesis protein [Bacteroidota bacterium]